MAAARLLAYPDNTQVTIYETRPPRVCEEGWWHQYEVLFGDRTKVWCDVVVPPCGKPLFHATCAAWDDTKANDYLDRATKMVMAWLGQEFYGPIFRANGSAPSSANRN